jgi:NTP pyrophosphatase (non-canonical NTP hydrolase)
MSSGFARRRYGQGRGGGLLDPETGVLVPEAIADSVLDEIEHGIDVEIPDKRNLANELADEMRSVYQHSKHYRGRLDRASDPRVPAYVFMRHWAASKMHRKYPGIYAKLPESFALGHPIGGAP